MASAMSDAAPSLMSADEFIAWSMEQPKGKRYELVAGRVVAMVGERLAHGRAKLRFARKLADAIEAAGLECEVFTDGMAVRIDETTVYEPDALLRCGSRLADDDVMILDPMIVLEVISPSSRSIDTGVKLTDYFRIASVRHYLIMRTESRTIIQHTRQADGTILTRIIADGMVSLDPPGIALDGLFE